MLTLARRRPLPHLGIGKCRVQILKDSQWLLQVPRVPGFEGVVPAARQEARPITRIGEARDLAACRN